MLLLIPLLLTISILEVSTKPDYYWRRFYGQVPHDAVLVAHTDQGPTYIGRASFEKEGMLVGPITECSKSVTVTTSSAFSSKTVHSVDKFAEILCSPRPHTAFKWVPASIQTFYNPRRLVEGGYQSIKYNSGALDNGVLYIGRLENNKEKIGKVTGYNYEDRYVNHFFYADGQHEMSSNYYEVLVYEDRNQTSAKMCPSSPRNIWPQDYYWRRLDGEVPYDAVSFSNGTFIGRAPFERKGLLVGPISHTRDSVVVTSSSLMGYGRVHFLNRFVEILCNPYSKSFGFVKTSSKKLLSITGLVEGGFEVNEHQQIDGVLYIGAINRGEGKHTFGKVIGYFKDDVEKNRLYYDQNDEDVSDSDYWVLTYHHPTETLFNGQHHHPIDFDDHTENTIVSSSSKILINTIE